MKKTHALAALDTPALDAVRRATDGRMSVYDLLRLAGAKNPRDTFQRISDAYPDTVAKLDSVKLARKDGKKANLPTPVTDAAGWRQIKMVLPGMIGATYRAAAGDLIEKALSGDIQTAAAIADRNSNARELEWLGARSLSKSTVMDLNGAISAAGCNQTIYSKVHDCNNVAVTGMTASEIQRERGVKATRDGMDVVELGLMIALQGTQAKQIRTSKARGEGQVLGIVFSAANKIAALRRELVGPLNYPRNGLLQTTI